MRRRNHKQTVILHVVAFFHALIARMVMTFGPTGVEVDVNDDSIDRWYVRHYRFDPERKQVRHVLLKAFSNQKAMMKYFHQENDALQARKRIQSVPDHEHISGGRYEPGYRAKIRAQRERNGHVGSNLTWYKPKK